MTKQNDLLGEELDKKMNISAHLEELRKRLIKILIVILLITVVIFMNIDRIMPLIIPSSDIELIYTAPADIVKTHTVASLYIALACSLPIIVQQMWKFVKPAVSIKKHKKVSIILFFSVVLSYLGMFFAYYIILPITLIFLTNYSGIDAAKPIYQVDKYFSFIFSIVVSFAIVFEIPLVITALGYFNLLTYSQLKILRKYAVLTIFIVTAILTPPDVVSQTLMAIPMIVLFECSLWILRRIEMRRTNE